MQTPNPNLSPRRINRRLDRAGSFVVGLLIWFFVGLVLLYISGLRPESPPQRVLWSLVMPLIYAVGEGVIEVLQRFEPIRRLLDWIERRNSGRLFSFERIAWGVLAGLVVVGVCTVLTYSATRAMGIALF
ncbi:hypothetical protein GF420_13800 [candidate division GN15 bacterium]|nr:hypothetical protein [candidate division GN15 bacterium]